MYLVNETIRLLVNFGSAGLSINDISYELRKNGTIDVTSVTLVEDSNGWYYVNFTPATVGNWNIRLTYGDFSYSSDIPVRLHLLNEVVSNFLSNNTIGNYINKIKIYVRNRLVISSGNYTIYENDGSTTHESGTVTTSERNPS